MLIKSFAAMAILVATSHGAPARQASAPLFVHFGKILRGPIQLTSRRDLGAKPGRTGF
jgi:hypothetical protein